jgi:Protein of unknown function (DUF3572)
MHAPVESELDTLTEACLAYLIGAPDELARFMDQTGLDGEALRKTIGSRSLALGLMDYFAQDEAALLAMCANAGLSAERFMRTWQRLNPDH